MRTAIMYIYRDFRGVDVELEIELSGELRPAEPDVGILHPFCEDVVAIAPDGAPIDLTPKEMLIAQERLCEDQDDC